ncbi:MAG: HipA domain-containing protein [Agitococcus sp.]|nr:HipA domain-containing protein [Agitococcus sp.]MDO9177650.1 HipA domain-containing protein [Agitococcus sp.]
MLNVWTHGKHIGQLGQDRSTGFFSFTYASGWLADTERFALSPFLPLSAVPADTPVRHSEVVQRYFQNLLPEAQALEDAAGLYGVAKSDLLGMLSVLGRETAGALEILPASARPETMRGEPRLVLREEMSNRIGARDTQPFSIWDNKIRLSLAGCQDKVAVLAWENNWFLVEGHRWASTFIVKPDSCNVAMAGITTNEFFCMRLSETLRLPTAKVSLTHLPAPALVVERFDRVPYHSESEISIRRLACIDGCQALDLAVDCRYERPVANATHAWHGGASLQGFFALLGDKRWVAAPGVAQLAFLRWVIFQVLIGNTDAHAKNVSFFSDAQGLRLTPSYDQVCGLVYAGIDPHLAMAIGDNFDPMTISAYNWAQLAFDNKLSPRLVAKELTALAKGCMRELPALQQSLLAEGAEPTMLARVAEIVEQQCAIAQRNAPLITEVDTTFLA